MPDFMGYDRAITLFSPDGRLLQVEYAKEPVLRGSPVLALKFKEGILIISYRPKDLKKSYGDFLKLDSLKKILQIDDRTSIAITGILSDGRVLAEKARSIAISYRSIYNKEIPVDYLVKKLGNYIQLFTQWGGARPFGVSVIVVGFRDKEPKIYMIEPSGVFFEYDAISIGKNYIKILKNLSSFNYSIEDSFEDVIVKGIKALLLGLLEKKENVKNVEVEELEIVVIKYDEGYREFSKEEIEKYLEKVKNEL